MEKILTIIVPTYNMERYLSKCLTSLIINDNILLENIEVLVINDGSTDHSSEIAHSFEIEYPDIFRVIDKTNGNYGSCINVGLHSAKGKYVKILDADDYYNTYEFEKYVRKLSDIDADLVLNNKITVDPDGNKTGEQIIPLDEDGLFDFYRVSKCWDAIDMHKMAYRRTILLDTGYRQTEGISYSDVEWMIKPFANIESAFNTGVNVYCYLQGRAGQTIDKSVRKKSFKSLHKVIVSLSEFWKNFTGDDIRKNFLQEYLVYILVNLYREFFFEIKFDASEFKEFDTEMASNYPEIIAISDMHQWVSFIPHLKLAEDWRRGRRLKFATEYGIIKAYLALRAPSK